MLVRTLVAISLLIPAVVFSGPAPPQGVWSGSIATKAIIVCFNGGSRWTSYASYYYVEHLKPIVLTTRDTDAFWHEENDTGQWELSAPVNGVVVGTWSHPKAQKTLPIKLGFLDGGDDKTACARDSYNSRLEMVPKVEIAKIIQFSPGRSYRKLRFAGQETIELFGPDPAIARINALLRLDQSKEAVDAYFRQRREFLGRVGYPEVDEVHVELNYWDAHFITIAFYTWVAGEGRSGSSNDYQTWNTVTGEKIALWTWFKSKSSEAQLPPKLQRYLFRKEKPTPECEGGYQGQGQFILTLSKTGLNVFEDEWGSGCEKSFFVPYAKLLPFLSPQGTLAVQSMLEKK